MSAILSVDDLNDFINPGIACIKPVETLPLQPYTAEPSNPYEVTTEEKLQASQPPPPAQISLTDCLACSGCVTSAEAVLVSLQSHGEVLDALHKYQELDIHDVAQRASPNAKLFIASVSPQARASLAATYGVSERQAGYMIDQLLRGPQGVRSGGQNGTGFTWIVDTNAMREASLVAAADEVTQSLHTDPSKSTQKKPIITSACPGWICYAEKTHPHILPHLSSLKSPQALTGVLLKSVLARKFGVPPQNVWHLAIMPCFDKKLEASRSELTSHTWHGQDGDAVRDVDCVITARELLMLAESRGIRFPALPRRPVPKTFAPTFPDAEIDAYLFSRPATDRKRKRADVEHIGTSGGYLHHILQAQQAQYPGSVITPQRGRNNDVAEYAVVDPAGATVFRAARYYGFRNIQNLVRRLRPPKISRIPGAGARKVGARRPQGAAVSGESDYAYVEVMACPGGCTNGGGQIKVGDVATLRQMGGGADGQEMEDGGAEQMAIPAQRDWLAAVDEAYWSADQEESPDDRPDSDGDLVMDEQSPARDSVLSPTDGGETLPADVVDGIDRRYVRSFLTHWATVTGIGLDVLLNTTYRVVESDVGKSKAGGDVDRVSALAVAAGGGW